HKKLWGIIMADFKRFQEILILRNEYENDKFSKFWFRGHSNATYKLIPSLYRLNLGKKIEDYQEFEQNSYNSFEEKCNEIGIEIPKNSWERICFMQHYGVKTKLLDWSESFDVALFFAFEGWNPTARNPIDRIATIWILDPNSLNTLGDIYPQGPTQSRILVPKKDEEKYNYTKFMTHRINDLVGTLAIELSDSLSADSVPNKRIKVQKGVFTLHETKFDLESELAFKADYGKTHQKSEALNALQRIDLHPDLYEEVKAYLNTKGLLHSKIYPDLEGISAAVNRLSIGNKNWYEVF
ncbi:FRG domain-containing protein, partial [Bacillus cereus]|nr:FRG domain-containing protein [Bacillus cereus]